MSEARILNAMTVDVEEHFQVSAFEGLVQRERWEHLPSRVEESTARLLDLFDAAEVQATFFILGWVAERRNGLVRRIAERGHEIASHGYSHKLVYDQTREEFLQETRRSKEILEDRCGKPVLGYRSASFSICKQNLWALDVLVEAGFKYDSSLYPVLHDRYGFPGAPRRIHRLITPEGGRLVEVPPSTLALGGATLAVAGGGYLRHYPWILSRLAVGRLNGKERMPAVVYTHPWEIDPGQPRIRAPLLTRLRHYGGLRKLADKLRKLMGDYWFGTVERVIREHGEGPLYAIRKGRHEFCAEPRDDARDA